MAARPDGLRLSETDAGQVLAEAKLAQHHAALQAAGCEDGRDLDQMSDEELQALGLKLVETRRLRRTLARLDQAAASERLSAGLTSAPSVQALSVLAKPVEAAECAVTTTHNQLFDAQPPQSERSLPLPRPQAQASPALPVQQQLLVPQPPTTIMLDSSHYQQGPHCCCKLWCPCLSVLCHEGCSCNLCGALVFCCCFTVCCWTPKYTANWHAVQRMQR